MWVWGTGVFGEAVRPRRIPLSARLEKLSVGNGFGVAVDQNSLCWVWGTNHSGELGLGDIEARITPHPLLALQGKTVSDLDCGGAFTVAVGMTGQKSTQNANDRIIQKLSKNINRKDNVEMKIKPKIQHSRSISSTSSKREEESTSSLRKHETPKTT